MKFIKNNFLSFVIIILLFTLFLDRCGKPVVPGKPIIIRDTVWNFHDSIVYVKPQLIQTIPFPFDKLETKYLPDTNYVLLLRQYNALLSEFLAKNIQRDSLKIDSIGYVSVTDTVNKNLIQGRTYSYNLKYPVITNTIYPKPKNQLYIGGSLEGNFTSPVNQINVGLLLKNKKDHLYGVYTGMDFNGNQHYGISSFWKIKLRK